jgi:hypothetical protein
MNERLKWKLEQRLKPKLEGKEIDMDAIDDMVIDFLCEEFPVKGLWNYLRALRGVTDGQAEEKR